MSRKVFFFRAYQRGGAHQQPAAFVEVRVEDAHQHLADGLARLHGLCGGVPIAGDGRSFFIDRSQERRWRLPDSCIQVATKDSFRCRIGCRDVAIGILINHSLSHDPEELAMAVVSLADAGASPYPGGRRKGGLRRGPGREPTRFLVRKSGFTSPHRSPTYPVRCLLYAHAWACHEMKESDFP